VIVKFPTGLYRDVLPVNPQDRGNVTFTISNTTPPRTNLVFPKIPVGLVDRGRDKPEPITPLDNRKYLGDLIFSISSSRRRAVGSNSKQFEIGQVLEFEESDTAAVEPMLVSAVTEIQHNNNIFDYDALGVTEEEQATIAMASLKTHSDLTDQLNKLKQQRADAEVDINLQQKLINETNRTIKALEVIAKSSSDVADLITKLKKKRAEATAARDKAIEAANGYAADAEAVLVQLRAVAMVLK
jgi:hypothetical protein